MEVVNKKIVLVILIIIGLVISIFVFKSNIDQESKLEEVALNLNEKNSMFAIMLEQIDEEGNSTYVESEDNIWPTSTVYIYDDTRSGCMDANGNKIENTLTYDTENNIASVKTEKTSYCYLYFRIRPNLYELCNDYSNMNTCILEEYTNDLKYVLNMTQKETGEMYRYQGSYDIVNNNYICFGTNDLEICTSNIDKYMYRIVGITSDGKMKLIKKEALDEKLIMNTNYKWEHVWSTDEMFKYLNDTEDTTNFLNNEIFFPNEWKEKINLFSWKHGNITNISDNINGFDSANTIYELENALTETVDGKISLMYIHDYLYASSWINIYNNDVNAPEYREWTMLYYGIWGSNCFAWSITSDDDYTSFYVSTENLGTENAVRPVFYVENSIQIIDGSGIITDPYIIL